MKRIEVLLHTEGFVARPELLTFAARKAGGRLACDAGPEASLLQADDVRALPRGAREESAR